MSDPALEQQFPIRTVSEMTGVNSVTLRAWERRYGLIKPLRTPKGHRLYTQQHIELINTVCDMLNEGRSISHIANELLNRQSEAANEDQDVWDKYMQRMVACIEVFDERCLDVVYNEANSIYPVDVVTNRLIVPLLKLIGERWSTERGTVAEEHFFSVYLRNKIGARFHHQNSQNRGKQLVAACLPGELHEFGLLLFALSAHSRGYRIILLGADMPLDELAKVAEVSDSHGILLAGSAHLQCDRLIAEFTPLLDAAQVPVFIGGDVVEQCTSIIDDERLHSIGKDITNGISTITRVLTEN